MNKIDRTFPHVGIVMTKTGVFKVSFCSDGVRKIKRSHETGEEVRLLNLPKPMLRLDALAYALEHPMFESPADQHVLLEAVAYQQLIEKKSDPTQPRRGRGRPRKNSAYGKLSRNTNKEVTVAELLKLCEIQH